MPNRPSIDITSFFDELQSRGLMYLYHSNSVETSISFFRIGKLISRDATQRQNLHLSSQWSDDDDKKFNIFADVFLNFHDLHFSFKKPNKYGPILFKIKIEDLKTHIVQNNIGLHITKNPPHNWKYNSTSEFKWRSNLSDLFKYPSDNPLKHYTNGWPDIVLSNTGFDGLPINLCHSVIIDSVPFSNTFYNQVSSIFTNCMQAHSLNIPLENRICSILSCKCKDSAYFSSLKEIYKYETLNWESIYGKIA